MTAAICVAETNPHTGYLECNTLALIDNQPLSLSLRCSVSTEHISLEDNYCMSHILFYLWVWTARIILICLLKWKICLASACYSLMDIKRLMTQLSSVIMPNIYKCGILSIIMFYDLRWVKMKMRWGVKLLILSYRSFKWKMVAGGQTLM